MPWYVIVGIVLLGIFLYAIGFVSALIYCDKQISNKKAMGDLYITIPELEPYLVAKVPMEEIVKESYIMLEVRKVDKSQK